MPICKKQTAQKRQACIGDMRNQISIYRRDLTAPELGSTDATETFTLFMTPWSQLESIKGQEFFNGTDTYVEATHKWTTRYIPTIDLNYWIQFQGIWYKILNVDNTEMRNICTIIYTTQRGATTFPVNEA